MLFLPYCLRARTCYTIGENPEWVLTGPAQYVPNSASDSSSLLLKESESPLHLSPGTMVGQSPLDPSESRTAVLLEPFVHQVGGHMSMMKYDEHTICKPLVSQELSFYESLPLAMRQFTPQYKGIVSVHLKKDSLGNLNLIASPSLQTESCTRLDKAIGDSSVTIWHKCKWAASTGTGSEHTLVKWRSGMAGTPPANLLVLAYANGNQPERNSYNPWGLHCHRQHLNRMSSKHNENKLHQFLLLENVVSKYNYPCILDLKMGTRQHGDDASEEKKARHIKKCEQSTSASLGVRICGISWLLHKTHKSIPLPCLCLHRTVSSCRHKNEGFILC
uniref:Kinase n=1 Tax=Athene cunicularia TaxID=194338 RepID=A0A663MI29_ATHCN